MGNLRRYGNAVTDVSANLSKSVPEFLFSKLPAADGKTEIARLAEMAGIGSRAGRHLEREQATTDERIHPIADTRSGFRSSHGAGPSTKDTRLRRYVATSLRRYVATSVVETAVACIERVATPFET